jgi:(2Fe-2S) ferredoxin
VYNEQVSGRNNEADPLGTGAKLAGKFRKGPMPKFERHIFICTNQRPEGHPRGCCSPSGEGELHRLFKEKLSERGIPNSRIRANRVGCLDQCEIGPTVVVYPEAVWYGHVTPADIDEIIDSHIVGGKLVERLIIPDSLLNNTQQLGVADRLSDRTGETRKE